MINRTEARSLILGLFEEEALVIGGLVAVHKVDDDLVWRLMKNLDVILEKTLDRLEDQDAAEPPGQGDARSHLKPHPAIEEFLVKLRRA